MYNNNGLTKDGIQLNLHVRIKPGRTECARDITMSGMWLHATDLPCGGYAKKRLIELRLSPG